MLRCIHFEFPRHRFLHVGVALCLGLIAVGLGGCESPRDRKVELDEHDQRLVNEIVELVRARVERTRDPARADSILATLPPLYDESQREALLDRLSQDTKRGAAVVAAVHDSLEALRDRIFPPGTSFGNPSSPGPGKSGELSKGRKRTP